MNLQLAMIWWFVISILAEVISTVLLFVWLSSHGVRLAFGLTGMPGYLEQAFAAMCKDLGRSSKSLLIVRYTLHANTIAAALCFIAYLRNV